MLLLVALSSLIVGLDGHSSGAPEIGCYTSLPMHDTHLSQNDYPPYVLEFISSMPNMTYVPGFPIKLRLRATKPEINQLGGFLVIVRTSSGSTAGTWKTLTGQSRVIKDCGVTQTSMVKNRTVVDVEFTPEVGLETIQFKAIAVHNYSVFWDTILSAQITPKLLPQAHAPDAEFAELSKIVQDLKKFNFIDLSFLTNMDPTYSSSSSAGSFPPTDSATSSKKKSKSSTPK